MGVYKFIHGNHGNEMFSAMTDLWKDEKYCDCTLVVDNFRIQLHKLVILAAWPSLMTSFSVTEDSGHLEIYLPDFINPNALTDFVSYLYNGQVLVTKNNLGTLETIADSLSNDTLLQICEDYRKTFNGPEESEHAQSSLHGNSLSDMRTTLSDMTKCNFNTPNNVESPNSSIKCKRKGILIDGLSDAKRRKINSPEICSVRTVENQTMSNKAISEVSEQNGAIKSEPTTDESDVGCVLDYVNHTHSQSNKDITSRQYQGGSFSWDSHGADSQNSSNDSYSPNATFYTQGFCEQESMSSHPCNANSPKVNKRIGKKYRNYTQEMLAAAFNDVKSGKHSVLRAARIHGVPEETLRDKIKGRRKLDCTQGRSHCFEEEEEHKILDTLEFYGKNGYKYKGVDIMRIATRFAVDFRKSICPGEDKEDQESFPRSQRGQKIYNRSIRGLKLTRKWFDGFYQRWKERIDPYVIPTNKTGKPVEMPEFSEEILNELFNRYETSLLENNLIDKPENIFFVEDIRLLNSIVGPRDERIQKSVSIAAISNLAGRSFPPYFVKEAIDSDAENFFEEIMGGLHVGEVLTLQEHLLTCMSEAHEDSPRVLLINGDKLFVLVGIEEWAKEHNIRLLIIPDNLSLYIRAFSIAVEGNFQKLVDENYEISPDLSAAENYQLFKSHVDQEFTNTFTADKLKSSFSKLGLFPVDVKAAKTVCSQLPTPLKKKNIRSGSRYKQYSQAAVDSGCDAVIHGGLSVLRASKIYGVPENTLRDFVKERRAQMVETNVDSVIATGLKKEGEFAAVDDTAIGQFVGRSLETLNSNNSNQDFEMSASDPSPNASVSEDAIFNMKCENDI